MPAPDLPRDNLIHFGTFTLDPDSGSLTRDGREVSLTAQPTRALLYLIARAGQVVTRDELIAHLWADRVVEYDQGLNFCVRRIRAALGDRVQSPTFIETVPGRGYRFVAPVAAGRGPAVCEPDAQTRLAATFKRDPAARFRVPLVARGPRTTAAAVMAMAVIAALVVVIAPAAGPRAPTTAPSLGPLVAPPSSPQDEARAALALADEYLRRSTDPSSARFAIELYKKAVELDASLAEAHALLAVAHVAAARYAPQVDDHSRAHASFMEAVRLGPEEATTKLAEGLVRLRVDGDRSGARVALDEAIARAPDDPRALVAGAELRRQEGSWGEAVVLLERAYRLDPRRFDTVYELATLHQLRGAYTASVRYWRIATALAPEVAVSYARFSLLPILDGGDYQGAMHLLTMGLARGAGPDLAGLAFRLAPLAARFDPANAARIWIAAAGSGPRDLLARAQILEVGRRHEAARATYDSVTTMLSRLPDAGPERDALLALAEVSRGNREGGLVVLQQAARHPEVTADADTGPELRILIAMAYTRAGELDTAIDHLEAALSGPSMLSPSLLRLDPAWDPLRAHPRFRTLADDPDPTLETQIDGV